MPTKLVLATVMAAVAASLLVASATAGGSAASAKGGTLRYNHDLSDYEYIDPQKCYDTGCSELLWPTSYNLMQYAEKSGPEGKRVYAEAAAGPPVVSKDGKTYMFTVRTGHKASNGKTVTPQWFVHAFERLLSPKMGDAASARFGGISNLGAVQGAQAFYDGKAQKISGLSVKGNRADHQAHQAVPVARVGARDELVHRDRSVDAVLRAGREHGRRRGAVLRLEPRGGPDASCSTATRTTRARARRTPTGSSSPSAVTRTRACSR